MTLAKICGLTTPETMDVALDGGAAFVGLVSFPKSPRHLGVEAASVLAARARGRARVVAVTVDADDALLMELAERVKPDLIQLHGAETPERIQAIRRQTGAGIIKALPVSSAADIDAAGAWEPFVDHLMFDARPPEGAALPGGVGHSFDWTLLAGRTWRAPWFLAGGLKPDNVGMAIRVTGAPAVDVSSGVETAPGVKDPALIEAFLDAVKTASPRS